MFFYCIFAWYDRIYSIIKLFGPIMQLRITFVAKVELANKCSIMLKRIRLHQILRRYNLLVLFGTLGQTNYSCSIQLIVETTTTHNFFKIKIWEIKTTGCKNSSF